MTDGNTFSEIETGKRRTGMTSCPAEGLCSLFSSRGEDLPELHSLSAEDGVTSCHARLAIEGNEEESPHSIRCGSCGSGGQAHLGRAFARPRCQAFPPQTFGASRRRPVG